MSLTDAGAWTRAQPAPSRPVGTRTTDVPVVMIEGGTPSPYAGWTAAAAAALDRTGAVHWFRTKGPLGRRAVPTRRPPDLASWSSDLAADTAELGCVDLAACGVGGLVALRFALDQPTRVRRLLLVDVPTPYWWVKPRAHRALRTEPVIDLRTSLAAVTEHVLDEAFGAQAIPVLPEVALAGLAVPALVVRSPGGQVLSGGDHLARVLPRAALVRADHDDAAALAAAVTCHFAD